MIRIVFLQEERGHFAIPCFEATLFIGSVLKARFETQCYKNCPGILSDIVLLQSKPLNLACVGHSQHRLP